MSDHQSRPEGRRHDQAELLSRLLDYLTPVEREGVERLAGDIVTWAGGETALGDYKVLVAFGGGKDSSYIVAFLRAAQLFLRRAFGDTFVLRVANMRHAGVSDVVMANIDRVYRALELEDEPQAELLVVDHEQIRPFRVDLPFPEPVRDMNRFDMLMSGHRTAGDGRPTFCNSCNLAVADFFGRIAWWRGGVDAVVTGDSRKEQKHYHTWIMRLADSVGVDVADCRALGFRGLLTALDRIGQVYYRDLFGAGFDDEIAQRRIACGDRALLPRFVSIYDLVSYRVDDHWSLIVDFLGFRFDPLAFSFTESDCANPMLMAHLRGLRARYLQGRRYEDGIAEYLDLATGLMRKKEMPPRLIALALSEYETPAKITARRDLAATYALEAFQLNESALVCMLFAPFVDQGAGLDRFLAVCHPAMADRSAVLHAVLAGLSDDPEARQWLTTVSGLSLAALHSLYRNTRVDFNDGASLIARVRANDPHKRRIATVDPVSGEPIVEIVSGR